MPSPRPAIPRPSPALDAQSRAAIEALTKECDRLAGELAVLKAQQNAPGAAPLQPIRVATKIRELDGQVFCRDLYLPPSVQASGEFPNGKVPVATSTGGGGSTVISNTSSTALTPHSHQGVYDGGYAGGYAGGM